MIEQSCTGCKELAQVFPTDCFIPVSDNSGVRMYLCHVCRQMEKEIHEREVKKYHERAELKRHRGESKWTWP